MTGSRPGAHDDHDNGAREPAPVVLDPVPAAALYELEVARRRGLLRPLKATGAGARFGTGCAEVDREVLGGGGFERGSVVGVSAEEVDFGVLVSVFDFCFV